MIGHIVVINDLSVPKGGATALALASASAFRARGYRVTLITGDEGDNAALVDQGVEIVALGSKRLLSGSRLAALTRGYYNADAARMVTRWIDANDRPSTIYHVHGWSQILSPSLFDAVAPIRGRLVYSAHDFFLACPNGAFAFLQSGQVCPHTPLSRACVTASCDRRSYAHKLWRVGRQVVQRHYYDPRHSPPTLAIHEAMRPFLMRAGIPSAAIEALPNPVEPWCDSRVPVERNDEILFIGRLEETKGPDLAAAAARAAGCKLRLIGDGVLRASLQTAYPEFAFMGHQPAAVIRTFAAQARMLVVPSRYPEPYGLVAAEALWSGLPVIITNTAFLADDIVAAGAGLAVEPRDTLAFAAAIRQIADDDDLAQRMSHAAHERTGNLALTPDRWIDRLIDAYTRRLAMAA